MSFLRHEEIYPSDGGRAIAEPAPTHRLDEFPAGYSLAGCAPAEPASASPTGTYSETNTARRTMALQSTADCGVTGCLSTWVHRNMEKMGVPLEFYVDFDFVNPEAAMDVEFEYRDREGLKAGDYYYVRMEQLDSGRAFSSPVWVN